MHVPTNIQTIQKHFRPIAFRHTVTLINGIFFTVVLLLAGFGEFHEALFIGFVVILNIAVGIVQDLRAKISLEQLQILMTPKVVRVTAHGTEENIPFEAIHIDDTLRIEIGDQIPADGLVTKNMGLEVNEALLTGESQNIPKKQNGSLLAGSIVTAGSALMRVTKSPHDSFVMQMTSKIKQYSYTLSPIQRSLTLFIRYMTYLLLAVVVYVVIHGITANELFISIIKNIAALTSTLVPQGLLLATTIFFAYGTIRLFQKNVLLQEINATEKLGLIKNLCIDKTGTLTENKPILEETLIFPGPHTSLLPDFVVGYLSANGNSSQTARALENIHSKPFTGTVKESLPFSSSRKYGAVRIALGEKQFTVVLGAPDILLPNIVEPVQRQWLDENIKKYGTQAKRLVLLALSDNPETSEVLHENQPLRSVALFVLANPLREGIRDIVTFFQNRGVKIRVISGDSAETVQAIAQQAGIKYADMIITGPEMAKWDTESFNDRVPAYHLFARVFPEQKEKIIDVLKHREFTAMIGDGANDALAIKHADLGIAMFEGASATRQIAQVVLMNNSFAALPTGVQLAETIITNIELVSGIFFYKVITGLMLFIGLASLGFTYPLSPRNDTIINYCTVWVAIILWTLYPAHKSGVDTNQSFLRRVLPFSLVSGLITALTSVTVFLLGPHSLQMGGSNILVVWVLIALGFWFLVLSPIAYGVDEEKKRPRVLKIFAGIIVAGLLLVMVSPGLSKFFDLKLPPWQYDILAIGSIALGGWLQYVLTTKIFTKWPFKKDNP